jgi:hypothetical protein
VQRIVVGIVRQDVVVHFLVHGQER